LFIFLSPRLGFLVLSTPLFGSLDI
jgi:hypothetical protein